MTLPVLHLRGTPYEQGRAHGRLLRQEIGHNLRVYFQRFQPESQLARVEVMRRARLYRAAMAARSPAYYEGMQGIADGGGFDLDDITTLNVRYVIIYYQSAVLAMSGKDGCTAFAVAPPSASSGHLLLGQNWDWIPWVKGAVLHTIEADGLETLSFTEAGIFGGKIGLNSAGLGLAINGLTSTGDDWERMIEANQPVALADLAHFLQDHTNWPSSICRHEHPGAPAGEQYRTVTSVLMDLKELTFHITDGPPCQNEFTTLQFEEPEW